MLCIDRNGYTTAARTLAAELGKHDVVLNHSGCIEAVAAALGFGSSNAAVAHLSAGPLALVCNPATQAALPGIGKDGLDGSQAILQAERYVAAALATWTSTRPSPREPSPLETHGGGSSIAMEFHRHPQLEPLLRTVIAMLLDCGYGTRPQPNGMPEIGWRLAVDADGHAVLEPRTTPIALFELGEAIERIDRRRTSLPALAGRGRLLRACVAASISAAVLAPVKTVHVLRLPFDDGPSGTSAEDRRLRYPRTHVELSRGRPSFLVPMELQYWISGACSMPVINASSIPERNALFAEALLTARTRPADAHDAWQEVAGILMETVAHAQTSHVRMPDGSIMQGRRLFTPGVMTRFPQPAQNPRP